MLMSHLILSLVLSAHFLRCSETTTLGPHILRYRSISL